MAEHTLEEYRRAQEAEWGSYVATAVIHVNGARAFNPGDPVPASHVVRGVIPQDRVRRLAAPAATTVKPAAPAVTEKG